MGAKEFYIYGMAAMGLICIGLVILFIRVIWQANEVFNSKPDFVLGDHPHVPEGTHGLTGKMGVQAGARDGQLEYREPGQHLPDEVGGAPCSRSTQPTQV